MIKKQIKVLVIAVVVLVVILLLFPQVMQEQNTDMATPLLEAPEQSRGDLSVELSESANPDQNIGTNKIIGIDTKRKHSEEVTIALAGVQSKSELTALARTYAIDTFEGIPEKSTYLIGSMSTTDMRSLALDPSITRIEALPEVFPLVDTAAQVHKNSFMQAIPGGEGENVVVGIGDGGELGTHLDRPNLINYANGSYTSWGDHPDWVSGTVGGRGIINPVFTGLIPKSTLITQKSTMINYFALDYEATHGMSITSNSYGSSFNCTANGTYNTSSETLDAQILTGDLFIAFASGNSGGNTCAPYPQGFKTVLRYYQAAKNVITVGNIEASRVLKNSSSRGPVADGRLKPEVVALGRITAMGREDDNYVTKSGTSGSTPVVAALAGQLQSISSLSQKGTLSSAATKAIIMNTADDIYTFGPDFESGFGVVNAKRAVGIITASDIPRGGYLTGSISGSEAIPHTIQIPDNVAEARVMLYWHDRPAEPYIIPSLVNDLDLQVSGNLPYVLSQSPTNAANPASPGEDHLNNVEQVIIQNPEARPHKALVKGYNVQQGPQEYVLTWVFIYDKPELQYPHTGTRLLPGSLAYIAWDGNNHSSDTATIQILNAPTGGSWETIASNIPLREMQYVWNIPETF
ncbi:MAG: hypothetical protein ACI83D_000227, partial [Planctomycetota bacterium]